MRRSVSIIFAATLCLSLVLILTGSDALGGTAEVRRITKEDLKLLLNDPDTTIIDVRQEGDWQESDRKIKGAVREDPMSEEESWAKKYPKDKNIVLYCA